ncbi:MAG: hypothetical protein K6G30_14505 [Acetatifactor sp.]|nr:hypothetical protein [Acetatifactor sp.]
MERERRDFFQVLCAIYVCVLTVLLPLYTKGTYWQLGDAKYQLFFDISAFSLGLTFAGTLLWGRKVWIEHWSSMDNSMLAYAGICILSAVCSSYPHTAWYGYRDWYMGTLTQLLLVGIYFFVSRFWSGSGWATWSANIGVMTVSAIAVVNRLGWDPLNLYRELSDKAWESSHMLSTVGNINWLCAYLGMALIFPIVEYLKSEKTLKRAILFFISILGISMLVLQGSDVGCVLALLLLGLPVILTDGTECMAKQMLLGAGSAMAMSAMKVLVLMRGSLEDTPGDGSARTLLLWNGWPVLAVALLAFGIVLNIKKERLRQSFVKRYGFPVFAAACVLFLCVLTFYGITTPNAAWANGRGALWRLAWEGWKEAPLLQKLIGAGPDCFAEYLGVISKQGTVIFDTEHWAGAVFANAHNEWLNQLTNIGIIGMLCYLTVFITAFRRYRGMLMGELALTIYFVNSMVSFQQVMNAPLLFLMLGICEIE